MVARSGDGAGSRAALEHVVEAADGFGREAIAAAVERAVREARFSDEPTDARGLFADLVAPGRRAFVLVNHVMHRRDDESRDNFDAKVTDAEVIGAVTDLVAQATGSRRLLAIGNSPLQGCDHARVVEESGMVDVLERWDGADRPDLVDLRGVVSTWSRVGAKLSEERRSPSDAVEVDLGPHSLLEQLYAGGRMPQFRVGDYAADETESYHAQGRHVYAVHRRLLESDLIVSVPTLKTHQKVGITCALKGTVGAINLKQCLAHHRLGGPGEGGDEYSPDGMLRKIASRLAERAGGLGTGLLANAERVVSKIAYRGARLPERSFMGGAWSGNDTAWRMTLDIARVLRFARPDGSLADEPQRRHVAVIDGLIAGEGEGPLRPTARHEGVIIAGTNPVVADVLAALAMGWDPRALNLLVNAVGIDQFPVVDIDGLDAMMLVADGNEFTMSTAPRLTSKPFRPPKGWAPADLFLGLEGGVSV